MKFNEKDVITFYRFFKHNKPTEIRVFDEEKFPNGKSDFVNNEKDFVSRCRYYSEYQNVSVYIGARDRKAKGDKNVISSHFIFIEIDEHGEDKGDEKQKILDFLNENDIKVSMIGMSGGGWHFYIPHRLQKFTDEEEAIGYKDNSLGSFKRLLLDKGFDVDPAVFNLERVTRVLGTFNKKRNKISNIEVIDNDIDLVKNSESLIRLVKDYVPKQKVNDKIYDIDDDEIVKRVKEKWDEGNRQDLTLSLAGYFRKEKGFGLPHTLQIIQKICDDCGDNDWNERKAGIEKTYEKDEAEIKGVTGLIEKDVSVNNLGNKVGLMMDKCQMAEEIFKMQPFYYDEARNWWLWDNNECKWERVDDTGILNSIKKTAVINTINSKERNEMLEALKQVGREMKPKPIKSTWIQFKDTIVDITTGERFKATPEWFVANPIPYYLDEDDFMNTPVMDKIFEEWVGKENVKLLYEILSYCLIPDYPIHRIFCFIGAGMNGKSCFLNLLRKFVGASNCCSTELDTLLQSRFEVTRLHKKLVCQMGETDFSEMNKTSTLKKLSGGDLIGFEYKNKDHFEDINYAKIIIATNNLPSTSDKTIGFYRRWMIIDFPSQFSEKRDILADIPEEEYNALANKCAFILKDLLDERTFTNEGSVEDRMKKYEDHSNPLEKFMKEFTAEDYEGFIWKHDFSKKLNGWCKQNRFREISDVAIGKKMKDIGIKQSLKVASWDITKKARAWIGIKFTQESDDIEPKNR